MMNKKFSATFMMALAGMALWSHTTQAREGVLSPYIGVDYAMILKVAIRRANVS